jgi:hypothetical protein
MADPLHELSDAELRERLSSGVLGEKKAKVARAILRRRRKERIQAWLKRHAWLAAILAAIGLASWSKLGFFFGNKPLKR